MSLLVISNILLWILVFGLLFAVFALARQIGLLHERIAPVGALALRGGPEVGEPAPRLSVRSLRGGVVEIGARTPRPRMLLFVSSDCPVCKRLIPLARSVARDEDLDLVFAGDAPEPAQREFVARHELSAFDFLNSAELGLAFQVAKLPFAVLLDTDGAVAAKGLVNTREHLESLVIAKAAGVDSIQTYLARRASAEAAASA
jgi:methylamine dehydrogenase accessory protein MauD